jgi:MoxR-like ATPase
MDELRTAQGWVKAVNVSDETIEGLIAIREACQAEGIIASDRRWKKSLNLVKAVAFMMGETKTSPEDLQILTDVLWREPKERDKIARIVGDRSDPATAQVMEVLDSARETVKRITALKNKKERGEYVGAAANAIDQFTAQKAQLGELAKGAGKRAKMAANDAAVEIQGMHAEAQRAISGALGFSDKARFSSVDAPNGR